MPPSNPNAQRGVFTADALIRLKPFTVFIHVHFQTLFQTARSALVSVSLVDRTAALHGERPAEKQKNKIKCCILVMDFSQLE